MMPSASDSGSTLLALITGDIALLRELADAFIVALRYFAERDESNMTTIVVIDGASWQAAVGSAVADIPRVKTIVLPKETSLPGVMVNHALPAIRTTAFSVVAIGCEVSTWYANRATLEVAMDESGAPLVAGYRGSAEARTSANESWLVHQEDQFSSDYPHAWLQMCDLVPTANALINTVALRAIGGMSEAPALQRMWWWECTLRMAKGARIHSIPLQPVPTHSWHRYPFTHALAHTVDANLAVLMRIDSHLQRVTPARADEFFHTSAIAEITESACAVQSSAWRSLPPQSRQSLLALCRARGRPLRIAILGGVNEPAHNQLCFFNYFAELADCPVITWRSFLDGRATAAELASYDLVIFSRARSAHGVALMQALKGGKDNRTLYMLDDNWFSLGREWTEYAELFTPGKPDYEHFLACVKLADTTLTYSAPLAADLAPHARALRVLPTNVNLAVFDHSRATQKNNATSRRTRIGFVGSLRKNMTAFDALVDIATRRDDIDVFVMSNSLPPEFAALPKQRVQFEPYQFNYAGYAATVVAAAPDILVAPIGRSRFEESKCPNKFLEITACGAVGVYSRAEPYLSHVVEGETGLFADDSSKDWATAIERLIDDGALRAKIRAAAAARVAAHYSTRAVLPQFVEMLVDALGATTSATKK
jgi:glycosyltransferase involved in cell wall biosynthesis